MSPVQVRPSPLLPPVFLVLAAIASVQFGAALAATLFSEVGPGGAVFLRVAIAAALLAALWRPSVRGRARADLALAAAFGVVLGAMNLLFYLAIDRLALGIAVVFEFVGPLGVAVATSRRRLDLVWVAIAGAGIALLSAGDLGRLDGLGVVFALGAGGCWAAYILLASRLGDAFPGGHGLALALVVAAVLLVPVGLVSGGAELLDPSVLGIGAAVALLSTAIPYSLELEALRRMRTAVFGVLMSLEPAVAAMAGLAVLDQRLAATELAAVALVVAASAGISWTDRLAVLD
ncbi:MAG: EamA family transporter [Thermoleophilia bacterium]|nr:EamA family transporter [Thermoleophilia bacterium]